jgi:endonuclease YncB( thermonuclease family)
MIIQDNYIRHVHSIEHITDGDTVTLIVESGFNGLDRVTVRFKGINTAEMKSKKGTERYKLANEAKNYVEKILKSKKVRLHSEKFEVGGFGRYLGILYYEDNGKWYNLNEELIKLGLAQVYYKGASKDYGEF